MKIQKSLYLVALSIWKLTVYDKASENARLGVCDVIFNKGGVLQDERTFRNLLPPTWLELILLKTINSKTSSLSDLVLLYEQPTELNTLPSQ